jgi:hypothetical protein
MMNQSNLIKNKFNQMICTQNDDTDENDLIDFSNIPSATLNVNQQQVSANSNSYADSSSSTSSLSSNLTQTTDNLLNNPILNLDINYIEANIDSKEFILKKNELEIIESIENLLFKYKWSAKLKKSEFESNIIVCDTCNFLVNISNFVKKFKNKLELNFNVESKAINDLINLYLVKLVNIILLKHECNQVSNNEIVLFIIKNFFKKINKTDTNNEMVNDSNKLNSNLNKIKKQLNEYIEMNTDSSEDNLINLIVNEFNYDDIKPDADFIDCCQINEEDALLANLDNLIENDHVDEFEIEKEKTENYMQPKDETNYFSNYNNNNDNDNDTITNNNSNNQSLSLNDSVSIANEDNSSILKAINKRKLHLSCPICSSCVVNMSDHLVKKHSIRDRNQRKYLMDVVRKTYINESKSKEINKRSEHIFNNNYNTPKSSTTDSDQQQVMTNSNNRKFIKCPICLDDNKYFVNISDHLIKIHHLVTSESRKPILRQIKENSLSFNSNKNEFLNQNQQYQQIELDQLKTYNYEGTSENDLILNESNQLLINDVFNESDQFFENNNTRSKRKSSKSRKLSNSNECIILNVNNNQQFNKANSQIMHENVDGDEDDDEIDDNFKLQRNIREGDEKDESYDDEIDDNLLKQINFKLQRNIREGDEREEDDEDETEATNQGDDSDYCDLIALNYESLTDNNFNFNTNNSCFETKRRQVDYDVSNKNKKTKFSPSLNLDQFNNNSKFVSKQLNDMVLVNDSTVKDFELNNFLSKPIDKNQNLSITSNMETELPVTPINKQIDTLLTKFNTIETGFNLTVKGFEILSSNIIKQLQTISSQFQETKNELDSFKKLLIEKKSSDSAKEQLRSSVIKKSLIRSSDCLKQKKNIINKTSVEQVTRLNRQQQNN